MLWTISEWWMLNLPNLCHCVQQPWKITGSDFWSSRNESKPLSKQKCVFEKMLWGISEMVNARASKSLPMVTSSNSWSSRNERKALSKLKHVFRKCCRLYQKWWMLKIPNLYHCVQYPWKLTSWNIWSSRNESKPLSMQKCVLRKCCRVSQEWWMPELSNLCHWVQQPWKLIEGISGALGMKERHL